MDAQKLQLLEKDVLLAVFDKYTRHEEIAIFCVTMDSVGNKIKKSNSHFITT